jgi:phenylalanyl-tRNA synthetase alpha chain
VNADELSLHLGEFRAAVAAADSTVALDEVRRNFLTKKSPVRLAMGGLRDLPPDRRAEVAAALNGAVATMEAELVAAVAALAQREMAARLAREWEDATLPARPLNRGARHPVSVVERRVMAVLRTVGFESVEGPEVEHPYYNFDALNIPEHHPARDMQDTFWVTGGWLLRSHTTTVQARVLEERRPLPIRIASFGRAYRNEAVDATHVAMFHQFEGLWIDRGLGVPHLKALLAFLARELYGDRPIRFKPKFYPYTEPSIGVDLQCGTCAGTGKVDGEGCDACHGAGWVTILGSGMVHPSVFREFGYDPTEVSGIAFGLGSTRMASQLTGVRPKALYEQDLRVFDTLRRRP